MTVKGSFSGSFEIKGSVGGGRGMAIVAALVVTLVVLGWISKHVWLLLAVLAVVVAVTYGLLLGLASYQARHGAIVIHHRAELRPREQLAAQPVVHLHLEGPDAVDLARQLVDGQRAIPAPVDKL